MDLLYKDYYYVYGNIGWGLNFLVFSKNGRVKLNSCKDLIFYGKYKTAQDTVYLFQDSTKFDTEKVSIYLLYFPSKFLLSPDRKTLTQIIDIAGKPTKSQTLIKPTRKQKRGHKHCR